MKRLTTTLITLSLVALLLGACVPAPAPSAPPPQATSAAIANPASQNCVKQGGTLEIRDETGGQVGYCIFADGSECEEWAFFRGECVPGKATSAAIANPASQNCVKQGGTLEIRDETGGQVGYCIFADGSECEEWAFFRGECVPGKATSAAIANPASENCVKQGGTLEIRDETGGQVGYCIFADGSECEEWAFFRGECAPGKATAVPPAETPAASATIQPLPAEVCNGQAQAMAHALDVMAATQSDAPISDPVTGASGTGCMATVTGTGEQFASPDAVVKTLGAHVGGTGLDSRPDAGGRRPERH